MVLSGLCTHRDYQGQGIASLLVRWGMHEATKLKLPVYVGGEERGILFYEHALGFKRLPKSEYWLDKDGNEISREEVKGGEKGWRREEGGVSGCDMVWAPEGVKVDEDGFVIRE
jgi:ribosomal protein S18 acetylase RimI-like enzyme